MTLQDDIREKFDGAIGRSMHSALVNSWASSEAWLIELKHGGLIHSIDEGWFNKAMGNHPRYGSSIDIENSSKKTRVVRHRRLVISVTKKKAKQTFYYICSYNKSINWKMFQLPSEGKWQAFYDKKRFRDKVDRPQNAQVQPVPQVTSARRLPLPPQDHEEDPPPPLGAPTNKRQRVDESADPLDSKIARKFHSIPEGDVGSQQHKLLVLLTDVIDRGDSLAHGMCSLLLRTSFYQPKLSHTWNVTVTDTAKGGTCFAAHVESQLSAPQQNTSYVRTE